MIATVVLAVEANGGEVKDIAGDGVLALFDVPADATRAAAAVLDGVRRITGPGEDAAGLDVRVGAAVGPVRSGDVRGAARVRVTGPAISQAVRLEARAEPGTALLAHDLVSATPGASVEATDRADEAGVLRSVPGVRSAPPLPPRGQRSASGLDGPREERRTVVALFAAVSRNDGDAGLEDGVVEEALARGVEIVERFGGTVKDLAGDVVVALFGAPIAHDDDRERAVLAGLALCGELPAVAPGAGLGVQAGVAAGRVVVGAVGAGRRVEYGAVGDAMNTAARLEANAEPGAVLVAEAARAGIEEAFEWGPPLAITAKGKRAPVVSHRALRRARPDPVLVVPDRPVVGRDRELAEVLAVVDRRGSLLIEGDAGIGKSALVGAAARDRAGTPWLLVRGASWSRDRHLGAMAALVDVDGPSPAGSRPEQVESRAADLLHQRLAEAAAAGVGALVVEDAQWLDDGSRRVLSDILAEPPIAVLVTARAGDAAFSLAGLDVLALGPLRPPDDRLLLDAVVGRAALPFDLEQRILEVAAGNPLVLHAQLQARTSVDGSLDRSADVPESVERLVLLQVDALDAAARAVVDALAVVGAPCTPEMLAAVVDADVADVASRLAPLVHAGLVMADGPRVVLAHGAFGEAVYGAILQRTRVRLHRRSADAVTPTDPGAGARHWALAGEPREAARLAADAALAARARVSYSEAAALFELAGRAGEEAGERADRRGSWWLQAGQCHLAAASLDAAMEAFAAASVAALETDDASTAAAAAVGYEDAMFETRRLRSSATDRGRRLLEAAQARADDVDDRTRARLLAAAGRERRFAVGADAAAPITDEAVSVARRSADPSTLSYALTAWRVTREAPELLAERSATDRELVAAATAAGDDKLEFEARRLVLMDQLAAGALVDAWAQVRALAALADRLGERRLAWMAPMWRAAELLAGGPFADALAATVDVYDVGRRAAYNDVVAVHALQEYLARRHLGSAAEVAPAFARARALAGDRWQVFEASLSVELDDLDRARRCLDAVLAQPDVLLGGDRVVGAAIAMATDAVVALRDDDAAPHLYERLLPWQGQHVVVGTGAAYLGPVDLVLGRLAAVAQDEDRARRHHTAALAQAREAGAAVAVGECAIGLASLVTRAERARLAEEAQSIGEATGSRKLVDGARLLRLR